MKPIHKFNDGNGATLCNACHVIIETGLTDTLMCSSCTADYRILANTFDSEHRVLQAVKEIAEERIKEICKERAKVLMNLKKKK